jgi:HD-GYP domain-containing protein (c-di-GMP phosphodiesterase class II)
MLAGLLHDIGKIGLPDEILRKPFNALNADERSLVVRHPVTGELALMAVDALKGAAALIRHHHERFDGAGYPDGLQGLAIPLGARILAVVNDYDALQLGTLVNRPLRPAEARDFLIENSGKRYDPEVVRAFLGAVPQVAEAVVLPGMPHRPATLRPGMVLARDLVHRDGYLLLAHGFVLDAKMIEQLARLEATEGHALTIHVTQGET